MGSKIDYNIKTKEIDIKDLRGWFYGHLFCLQLIYLVYSSLAGQ